MKIKKKTKPKPTHWLYTLRWWNPIVYIMLLVALIGSIWDGGIKEWVKEIKRMINEYDWT